MSSAAPPRPATRHILQLPLSGLGSGSAKDTEPLVTCLLRSSHPGKDWRRDVCCSTRHNRNLPQFGLGSGFAKDTEPQVTCLLRSSHPGKDRSRDVCCSFFIGSYQPEACILLRRGRPELRHFLKPSISDRRRLCRPCRPQARPPWERPEQRCLLFLFYWILPAGGVHIAAKGTSRAPALPETKR